MECEMQPPMPIFEQSMMADTSKGTTTTATTATAATTTTMSDAIQLHSVAQLPSSPELHKSVLLCPTSNNNNNNNNNISGQQLQPVKSGVPTTVSTGLAGVVSVVEGKQIGDRLFLQTSKLKLLLDCLEALNEAATIPHSQHSNAREPRPIAIAFTPQGVYVTVSVPAEGRCHSLCLSEFFFIRYRTISPGFRAIVDFREFIFYLNLIYSTHHGRCLEILDQPDNTLLVHALLDENKFFDATLKTHVPSRAAISEPILQAAYYRYPFLIKVSTNWLHNIFKRLQQKQRTEVIVEFNGETGALEFLSTMEGAPFREGVIIPPNHILQNPFLPPKTNLVDTHVVYTDTRAVTEVPKDRVPPAAYVPQAASSVPQAASSVPQATSSVPPAASASEVSYVSASGSAALAAFRYRSQFAPRSIWLAVKRNKVGSFIHMYIAPKEPILFQYILQRSHTDSRRAASYDTWIKAVEKAANPNIRMPAGGSAAVARKMLEIAPNLGSNEQTLRVGAQAIQQITGYSPNALDKLKLQDKERRPPQTQNLALASLAAAAQNRIPTKTNSKPMKTSTVQQQQQQPTTQPSSNTNVSQIPNNTTSVRAMETENGFVERPAASAAAAAAAKRKLKSRSPLQLDAEGNPIKKKRGRPPKNSTSTTTPTPTPTPTTTPSISNKPVNTVATPSVSVTTPSVSVTTPSVSVATPSVSVATPSVSVATPFVSVAK